MDAAPSMSSSSDVSNGQVDAQIDGIQADAPAQRTFSRLPRNNPNRRPTARADSLQSLGSSSSSSRSLYASKRDDDLGRAII